MPEIDCEYTRNIVCPFCGREDRDSWEVDFGPCMEGETNVDCGQCGEEFVAYRQVQVTYSSRLPDTPEEKAEQQRRDEAWHREFLAMVEEAKA